MGDGILTGNNGAIGQTGADVVAEHAVYHRVDSYAFWDATDDTEEVDCAFEIAREQTRSGKEQITDGGRGKIESIGRACSFENLEVQMEKCSSDKFSLRQRYRSP